MKSLSVKEIHELSRVVVSIEYTDEVKTLLDRFEAEEISFMDLLDHIRRVAAEYSALHQGRTRSTFVDFCRSTTVER